MRVTKVANRLPDLREENAPQHSNRRQPSQRNEARASMAIAARALHITKGNANRGFRVAWLHAQVQVHHSAATVAVDNEPVMF